MQYRPEIDGLRAVAVMAVIFCHAGFSFFSGGYVGVDIFFVISGFLITSIILNDIKKEQFSLINFYEKRARRILPALFFVLLFCLPFAWHWMLPEALEDFGKSIVKVNTFVSNFYFWQEVDYFSPNTELMPLLHTWSLAVEEQFYLLFPLLLMLVYKYKPSLVLLFICSLIVFSYLIMSWLVHRDQAASYYLLHTRAWELAIGALIALYPHQKITISDSIKAVVAFIGLLMIVFSITYLDEQVLYPSYWTLLPVLGAALVITFSVNSSSVAKVLAWKPLVGIGLVSYSAYLWHQPVFSFARIRLQSPISVETYFLLILLILTLAFLSWRYIEQPFRRKTFLSRQQIFTASLVAILLFVVIGKVFRVGDGLPSRFSDEMQQVLSWSEHGVLRTDLCKQQRKSNALGLEGCLYGNVEDKQIALIGDSHALTLAVPLAERFTQAHFAMSEYAYSGCAPIMGYGDIECSAFNQRLFKHLLLDSEIETVIISALWSLHFEATRFDNGEGGVAQGKNLNFPQYRELSEQQRINQIGKELKSSIEQLLDSGKRVVLIYPIPEVGWNVPNILARQQMFGYETPHKLSTNYSVFKERVARAEKQMDLIQHTNLIRIKPEKLFCDEAIEDRCIVKIKNTPIYFDDNHLNYYGATHLADFIIEAMVSVGWL